LNIIGSLLKGGFKPFWEFIILTLFFSQKYFGIFNFGHFFCPFFKNPKKSWRKTNFVTETKN
jgi:hypothetical protein